MSPSFASRIAIVGGGRMGSALVGGLLDAGTVPDKITVAEPDSEVRHGLEERFRGIHCVPSAAWAVANANAVVLAIKPPDVSAVLEACAPALSAETLVVSIAAGITIASLELAAPSSPVVRAMPNTPALVGLGAAAIAGGTRVTESHLVAAEEILGTVGIVVRVPESLLDAVTGLSGSGPAYVFLVAEALIDAGVMVGLSREDAEVLVRQTLLGAATLLSGSGETPEALRAAVTSPGGTTAAGVHVLEDRGVRGALQEAVAAATHRSEELGRI